MNSALPPPVDVRLMNTVASILTGVCAVLFSAIALAWLARLPVFAVGGITVMGDVEHNGVATLRANVAPRLAGNFITLDLAQARKVFESVPWVRQAEVRRQFPNRLQVTLQEHRPVAFWGAGNESRMVNSFGEVFEANVGEVEQDDLPRLAGPDGQAAEVLAMYRLLKPVFEQLDLGIEQVSLSVRGSWSLTLDTGAQMEMGRGTPEDIDRRVRRFTRTLTQVTSRHGRQPEALVSADLRHEDGYAVRLRGVGTTESTSGKK